MAAIGIFCASRAEDLQWINIYDDEEEEEEEDEGM